MKKILTALVATFAVLLGPTVVAGPAAADDYVIKTPATTRARAVDKVVPVARHPKVRVNIQTPGNTEARGEITIIIRNNAGKVIRIVNRRYFGEPRTLRLPKLRGTRAGKRYVATVKFRGKGFERDRDRVVFRVKRR